jgi:hypothetical protein
MHREITRCNTQGKGKCGERWHTKTRRHEGGGDGDKLAGVPPVCGDADRVSAVPVGLNDV